ncbi:8-amino-7-oxononanoate synthase, partial [Xanthomonas perforans]|nr:8-amino-7-oxononanoate synthase [Xanthomonas perforans]
MRPSTIIPAPSMRRSPAARPASTPPDPAPGAGRRWRLGAPSPARYASGPSLPLNAPMARPDLH